MADLEIDDIRKDEPIYDIWERRSNPRFEIKYRESVIKYTCDWNLGTNKYSDGKNKVLGAGYETYIIAFFIGLYAKRRKPLTKDRTELDNFHWPVQNWGNIEERGLRHKYPSLRRYIFIALVARADIDWLAVEKGEVEVDVAVRELTHTMEEYANYGYSVMAEKLHEDQMFFLDNHSYLNLLREIVDKPLKPNITDETEPESLD